MLGFYMLARGLKRLEGELNTIRLQKNGQPTLQINRCVLPEEYNLKTLTLTEPDWEQILNAVACPVLRLTLQASVVNEEPDKERIRQRLQEGHEVAGAALVKGDHVRFD
jgi:hypothetical protein